MIHCPIILPFCIAIFHKNHILSYSHQLKSTNKISERHVLEINKECKPFLITILGKLQDKSPVQHQLVRSMQYLDPRSMAGSKEKSLIQMKRVLQNLVAANRVDEIACDGVLREFSEFCDFASLPDSFKVLIPKKTEWTLFYTSPWESAELSPMHGECTNPGQQMKLRKRKRMTGTRSYSEQSPRSLCMICC